MFNEIYLGNRYNKIGNLYLLNLNFFSNAIDAHIF